jgi:peptidoglycan/LPS O-acetylase OafA/YrhL
VLQRRIQLTPLIDRLLEVAPLICVAPIVVVAAVLPEEFPLAVFTRPLVAFASAAFILRLVLNDRVSGWLRSPFLCSMGHNSYSIYLVHMAVAGIVHGLITGAHPDIGSSAQNLATALSFGATLLVAFALTKAVEDPATRLGRSFRWSRVPRGGSGQAQLGAPVGAIIHPQTQLGGGQS